MVGLLRQILGAFGRGDSLGRRGEALAAAYLRRKGYRILLRNCQVGNAELDIVALDGPTLVFVEVKTRQSEDVAHPEEQVDLGKQHRLTRAARTYLSHYQTPPPARFDVVAIVWDQTAGTDGGGGGGKPVIRHHIAAFTATHL